MGFIKNIFGKKDEPIKNYSDFWNWFQSHEKNFFNVVKNNKDIEKNFFDKISPKLDELKDGYFFVTGMHDDNTAELILTADGNIEHIAFVEELVASAPTMQGWKITAHKSAMDIEDVNISMGDYKFNSSNIYFYSNDDKDHPDEIDISVMYEDLTDENREQIGMGVYIFLDNYLGEIDFVNNIDNLKVIGRHQVEKELVPIERLKAFLNWRQKEFVEKYEGIRYGKDDDNFSILEAEFDNGNKLVALVNSELLDWDSKASHPWIAKIRFKYNGEDNNGFPEQSDYQLLDKIEESITEHLSDKDGFLNIGRQTANNVREVYFACKDFRKPSTLFYKVQSDPSIQFKVEYEIYKDKYWKSFNRFVQY